MNNLNKSKGLDGKWNHSEIEDIIYKNWEKSGYFNPDKLPCATDKKAEKFTAIMAPPNITGNLHMGHALENTLVDALVRRKRMQGFKALWVPGTDHAGIATQNVVEKKLAKNKIKRKGLGKEVFVEKIWEWKEEYGDIILNQFKKIGISVDWSRSRFTLDEDYKEAVRTAFKHYQDRGWLYKGQRLVNWCPRCSTALSDLEVEHSEDNGNLWYIKYPLKDKLGYITVATTRPETMLGDTAVAVSLEDERYKKLIGKTIILPIINREIPIIADKEVAKDFGTGAVKITPAHSQVDFEIGERHNLPSIKVIDERGRMNEVAGGEFKDLKTMEAREKVIEILKEKNLLEKIENHSHNTSHCYRCNSIIEPLTSDQWFLKMNELAKLAKKAVKDGQVKFHPKKWEKPYFNWLDNLRDWCVSRQIWWGHDLPVEESSDVLDTWFSSALWPFAILGWPQNLNKELKNDLKTFYPADLITSAPDILYLWITRMIFSGMEFMDQEPFKNVYIHPVVLTKDGRRMSKSLGTGIDPLGLIEKYGADAMRFGLLWMTGSSQSIRFNEDTIIMGQKFCNKFWNATKFILMNEPPVFSSKELSEPLPSSLKLNKNDKIILSKLNEVITKTNTHLDSFRFDRASEVLYEFFWHDLCDVYLENSKQSIFEPESKEEKEKTQKILFKVLFSSLKLLHPFIPFITEYIYENLPIKNKKDFLMIEEWPTLQ
jgi:valyl-tRNA synthetase